MAHKWYAIQTYSGSELAVKRALIQLSEETSDGKIAEVLVPTEDLIEVKKGKKSIVERPLYPAYAFAKIDLDTGLWHAIQSMAKKPKVSFEEGEMVRVNEGPFANFNGIVEDFDMASGQLKLNVSIFGRNTPVEISYTQVERVV